MSNMRIDDTELRMSEETFCLHEKALFDLTGRDMFSCSVVGHGQIMAAMVHARGKQYFADIVTGTMYDAETLACMTSSNLRMTERPKNTSELVPKYKPKSPSRN